MAITITKEPAVLEDLDLGTGTNARGTKINASGIPMSDGSSIEDSINEITDPAGTPDPRYALHGGDLNVPFMVGLRSPAPFGNDAVRYTEFNFKADKTELANYALLNGNAAETFEVAPATKGTDAINQDGLDSALTGYPTNNEVLRKDNTQTWGPNQPYQPATKAYVDSKATTPYTLKGETDMGT